MSRFSVFKLQLRILASSRRIRYSALACSIGVTVVHLQGLSRFWSRDCSVLPSAAVGWMANHEDMHTAFWVFLTLFILPVLACILHGDVLFDDAKKNRLPSIISRSSRNEYILSSALLVFFSAFFFVFAFGIISQLVAFLAFPFQTDSDTFQTGFIGSAAELGGRLSYIEDLPFGHLASINLYLFNLAYMLYDAYYMASLALISFAISLYLRKSRLFILILPTALILLLGQVVPSNLNPGVNMLLSISKREYLSLFSMLAVPTGCLVLCIAAIMFHEKVLKGDLL